MAPRTNRTNRQPKRPDWTKTFLASLARTGHVGKACKVAKIGRTTVYGRAADDKEFDDAWKDALAEHNEAVVESLEDMALRRAKKSDTVLIFLLKSRKPTLYRDSLNLHQDGAVLLLTEEIIDAESGPKDGPAPPPTASLPAQ